MDFSQNSFLILPCSSSYTITVFIIISNELLFSSKLLRTFWLFWSLVFHLKVLRYIFFEFLGHISLPNNIKTDWYRVLASVFMELNDEGRVLVPSHKSIQFSPGIVVIVVSMNKFSRKQRAELYLSRLVFIILLPT